jgi:diguanylate cyclase (GGDEF)-like protein
VRQSDTVARLGGDEFVLLLDSPKSQDEVLHVAQRVVKDINEPMALREQMAHVGVSIGIAFFPKDGRTPRELLKSADAAMYRAKEAGKNTYHLC